VIVPARVFALFRKELAELSRNRAALVPVFFVGLISMVLPFFVAIIAPRLSGHPLSNDADLVQSLTRATGELPGVDQLSEEAAVQAFIFSRFLVMTLLVPVTGAITFAGHSLVGEKLGRSLEPLLATPITTTELLVAKVAGALVPSLTIMLVTFGIYLAGIAIWAEPGVLRAMLSPKTALLVFGLGPMTSLLALQVGVLVSARVNDPRTAQQFGALFILPLTALFMAQMSGVFVLTMGVGLLILLGLIAAWLLLLLFGIALFEREAILTRWK
jgi:ABC-2 type transport system permease protein